MEENSSGELGCPQMRQIEYQDERGRKYLVRLPDDAPDSDAEKGVPIGPPDIVDELELPEPFATRLHNELFNNRLWGLDIIRKRPKILFGILQRLLKVDVHMIINAYAQFEKG